MLKPASSQSCWFCWGMGGRGQREGGGLGGRGKGRSDRSGRHQGTDISWHSTEQTQSASLHQGSPTHHSQKPGKGKRKTLNASRSLVTGFLQTCSQEGRPKPRRPISSRRPSKDHWLSSVILGSERSEKPGHCATKYGRQGKGLVTSENATTAAADEPRTAGKGHEHPQ